MYKVYNLDCISWMSECKKNSFHAIVTDPPYALQEYTNEELEKKRNGIGGIWRLPPSFDGSQRSPLPRFSVINDNPSARKQLYDFFKSWAATAINIIVPGAHLFIASTPLLSDILSSAMRDVGFERRGELVRLVTTLRGGDRPKGAEKEFEECCVLPRASWEPWGVYRKPLSEKTVTQNLRKWGAGALRRQDKETPFYDVIDIGRTPKNERQFSDHPTQKPLLLMLKLVHAVLPLGEGVILDPFLGSGTTIAAAEFYNFESVGIERDCKFYNDAIKSIPKMIAYLKGTLSLTVL